MEDLEGKAGDNERIEINLLKEATLKYLDKLYSSVALISSKPLIQYACGFFR